MTSRRHFIQWLQVAGAVAVAGPVLAQGQNKPVDEKEPQAASLGYVADAERVDKGKFPKFAPPQHCANCQFFQGTEATATAPCQIFANRGVAATGWCSAYVAKPR
jgi:hypothetical protein